MKNLLTSSLCLFALLLQANAAPADAPWSHSGEPASVAADLFTLPDDLEVTIWASTPQLFNPTNMDIDHAGRVWVCEGVNYRRHAGRRPGGDRIAVIEDTDGDGKADSSHTFVQEKGLIAPLGIGVIGNKIYVSQPPEIIVYTDVDRNLRFDPAVDTREILLTGFNARNHDHSLHSVTAGPDGKLYFNNGNCGAIFTDRSDKTFYMGGPYRGGGGDWFVENVKKGGTRSSDGHIWTAGFTARMNPDGTNVEIVGHGYRNSYEQTVTSRGDLFQNDNDDPPACRTSYILEYGCAGYFSRDAKRGYRSEARSGVEHWQNHWRQLDPGTMDVGDVYGGGSPTGVTYYENGALGDHYVGSLFTCEPGKNVVFAYQPKPKDATFDLVRSDFLTSNPDKDFDGSDFVGGTKKVKTRDGKYKDSEHKYLFRPSDITVGPDGALYVCDWFDSRVGGHSDLDESCSGTIYRIAPKGFQPKVPSFDPKTSAGAVTALSSPAINTRFIGFQSLKSQGPAALEAVSALLENKNPYLASRAIWLLPYLGPKGLEKCQTLLSDKDPQVVITAYRALRRAEKDILPAAQKLASHPDAGVRRDVALSLRDLPAEKTAPIFVELARHLVHEDKNSVEAMGLGAANQENVIWLAIKADQAPGDPTSWSEKFTRLTWRLWPDAAVADLTARALDSGQALTHAQRVFAVESIAFIDHPSSPKALFQLFASNSSVKPDAATWLLKRGTGEWAKYDIKKQLKETGVYDPSKIKVTEITVPPAPKKNAFTVADVLALEGNVARGKATAMRCIMCHEVNGTGATYGPALKGWGQGQTPEVIARSIVTPSADISHGFDGSEIKLKDGRTIHGLIQMAGDPTVITSTGGVTQMIPKKLIEKTGKFNRSLMLSADQMALSPQDVADLVSFLKSYK
jgi:putative membrane-bound dehydrogenase-like protein